MKNLLRRAVAGLLAGLCLPLVGWAQAPPVAGRLEYEATKRVDISKISLVATQNGQPIKLSAADMPNLPTTTSFDFVLVVAGKYAKEEPAKRQMASMIAMAASGETAGRSQRLRFSRPYEQTTYLNLADRTATTILVPTEKPTTGPTAYRAEAPLPAPLPGWEYGKQTKKIAGYLCRKATVPYNKEVYTLWVTTELPFTYSPVHELTPAQGVVLDLSSEQQQYTASKFIAEKVAEADVRPAAGAQVVTAAEMKEIEARYQADQRQRLTEQLSGTPR